MAIDSKLFQQIPENLFSVLSGPLKEVHSELLFLVYEQYQRTIYTLPRELVIDLFAEYLEELGEESFQQLDAGEYQEIARNARERANQFLRKFLDSGWLIQEPHYDYTFNISIPDYALTMLEALDKIRTGYRMEFKGRVLSIYQNLTGEESMSYVALQQAAELTAGLIDGLKRLNHSIKKYTENLLVAEDAREVLNQVFDRYQPEILGEQYYRLKTSEHISKYRTGILSRVKQWESNRAEIQTQAQIMVQEKQVATNIEGENWIYQWLDSIEEAFMHMDDILEEIDKRNTQYARAALERLRFKLLQGRGIGQRLAAVLNYLAEQIRNQGEREEVDERVQGAISLFPQSAIDELSVKKPARKGTTHTPRPLETIEIAEEVRRAKLHKFRSRVEEEITIAQINDYVLQFLQERQSLNLSELPMESKEEWIQLIYIILFSKSRKAQYLLSGKHGGAVRVKRGKIEVPSLVISRKEQHR